MYDDEVYKNQRVGHLKSLSDPPPLIYRVNKIVKKNLQVGQASIFDRSRKDAAFSLILILRTQLHSNREDWNKEILNIKNIPRDENNSRFFESGPRWLAEK